jgi:PHD/YefM family antitoxin component YafN of YafNO toxin-antitoxin module
MKTVNARDLQKKNKECVDISQQDQLVITRRGKPGAVISGGVGAIGGLVSCSPP